MALHAPVTHTLPHETTKHLTTVLEAMKSIDLEGLLTAAAMAQGLPNPNPHRSRRGPAAKYVPYTATAMACCLYEMVAAGADLSIKEMLDRFWFDYTSEHLDLLGMTGLRHPERLAAMTPNLRGLPEAEANRLTAIGNRVYNNEYARLVKALDTVFACIDDTPLTQVRNKPGTKREDREKRHTKEAVAVAASSPLLLPRTAAKTALINAIIAGGLRAENLKRHGDTDVLAGILAEYKGHLAIDETHLEDAGDHLPNETAPGNYNARVFIDSRNKDAFEVVVGLTLGVAGTDPKQEHRMPDLVLGASMHTPGPGSAPAVLDITDAVAANGLRPENGSNSTPLVIVDRGYLGDTLNEDLTARGYGMVMEYKSDRHVLFELGAVNNAKAPKTEGIRLFNGAPLCPGTSLKRLHQLKKTFALPREDDMSDADLLAHQHIVDELTPFIMRTNGRPKKVEVKKRGGQSKVGPAKPTHAMRVTVTCPAIEGKVRCPIFANFTDPGLAHLPAVPAAPTKSKVADRPACCRNDNGTQTLNVPMHQYKIWQPLMLGTWDHADFYTGNRAVNERYNGQLVTPEGTDLSRGEVLPRGAIFWALTVAVAIAVTNARALETHEAKSRKRGGDKPAPRGKANRRRRARRLERARAARRRPATLTPAVTPPAAAPLAA